MVNLIVSRFNAPLQKSILYVLANLKQRWTSQDTGTYLVGAINYPDPRKKLGKKPTVSVYTLPTQLQKIAHLIPDSRIHGKIMEFQRDAWNHILTSRDPLIICAPTGFGKTEAFLPPVLHQVLNNDTLAILIYPRRELIADQLARILEMYKNIEKVHKKKLRIGIQFEGISTTTKNTLMFGHRHGNQPFDRIIQINNILQWTRGHVPNNLEETLSQNKIVRMKMNHREPLCDDVYLNIPRLGKCPICKIGEIKAKAWYSPSSATTSRGYQLRRAFSRITNFQCTNPNCSVNFVLSLSKKSHIEKDIHVLITTVESLEILLMNPSFVRWFKRKLEFLVFDEIHVYHSLYGAHVANIVRRIKSLKPNVMLIGASATIDRPSSFGKKFFDASNVKVISPTPEDIKELSTKEHFYFIRSGLNVSSLATYIQTAMLLGHSIIPIDKKMLFFFDSRDLVYRARQQLLDAEANRLWEFRVSLNNITFNNNVCPGYSVNCHQNCEIFKNGECWYVLSKLLNNQNLPITRPLNESQIESVTAVGREYNTSARLINTTSVLELGVDDPKITFVGQYKAPHTVFSFLQRKGRGGRRPSDDVHVFMILGNDTSDLFYFRRADNIVSQNYSLPLEPNNPYIKYLHDLLQQITEEITSRISQHISNQAIYTTHDNFIYTWNVLLDRFLCDKFKNFLSSVLRFTLSANNLWNRRDTLCNFVEQAIQDRKNRIESILSRYRVSVSPIQVLDNYIQKLSVISNEITNNTLQDSVLNLIALFKKMILSITQRNDKEITSYANQIIKVCGTIISSGALSVNSSLYTAIVNILGDIRSLVPALPSDVYQIEKLRYEIESLRQLCLTTYWGAEGAFSATSINRIVKYLLRSWYFYCKSCMYDTNGECTFSNQSSNAIRYPIDICPVIAYFEEPVKLMLEVGGRTRTITEIDSLFTYIPYKTTIETEGRNPYILSVKPSIDPQSITPVGNNSYEFKLLPSYFSGRSWLYENTLVSTPEIIYAEKLDLDPQAETLVKFCPKCLNYYNFSATRCPNDNTPLIATRIYVEPLIDKKFKIVQESNVSSRLSVCELTGYQMLYAINVEVLKYYHDNRSGRWKPGRRGSTNPINLKGVYDTPIVFSTDTRGIVFHLDDELINEILNDEVRSYLTHKKSSPEEILFHTVAHVLLLLVSAIAGVNPELLWYGWDAQEKTVAVWDRYEGGSGIIDTFLEILQTNSKRVYDELEEIVHCPVHEAEAAFSQCNLQKPTNPFQDGTQEYIEFENLLNSNPKLKLNVWKELKKIIFSSNKPVTSYTSRDLIASIANNLSIPYEEVTNHLPSCIDGCPACIGVPYCTSGKEEQYVNISLKVAKKFVDFVVSKKLLTN